MEYNRGQSETYFIPIGQPIAPKIDCSQFSLFTVVIVYKALQTLNYRIQDSISESF